MQVAKDAAEALTHTLNAKLRSDQIETLEGLINKVKGLTTSSFELPPGYDQQTLMGTKCQMNPSDPSCSGAAVYKENEYSGQGDMVVGGYTGQNSTIDLNKKVPTTALRETSGIDLPKGDPGLSNALSPKLSQFENRGASGMADKFIPGMTGNSKIDGKKRQ
ncbi:MAG: hypothetical protein U0T83_00685 [Bacteriovoracaceae bacterium]